MYVRIFVDATVHNSDTGENEVLDGFGYYNQNLTGNFDGDTFEYSEWDSGDTYWQETTATGRIDPATGVMLDFVIETNRETYNNEGVLVFWEHRLFDLVSDLDPGFGRNRPMVAIGYGVVCSFIERFEFESSIYTLIPPISCDSESYIRLEWYTE